MIQITAVMPHKQALKLPVEWKPGRSNAYTQTMTEARARARAAGQRLSA